MILWSAVVLKRDLSDNRTVDRASTEKSEHNVKFTWSLVYRYAYANLTRAVHVTRMVISACQFPRTTACANRVRQMVNTQPYERKFQWL